MIHRTTVATTAMYVFICIHFDIHIILLRIIHQLRVLSISYAHASLTITMIISHLGSEHLLINSILGFALHVHRMILIVHFIT